MADKPGLSSFFRLLSCGLFGHEVTDVSAAEWHASLALAHEQRVEGLLYAAALQADAASRPPMEVSMALYSHIVRVERLNETMARRIAELFDVYDALDAAPVLLKGHGVAANYRHPEWRTPGDIDVFVGRNFGAVDAWARVHGTEVTDYDPVIDKHVEFHWERFSVENHFCLSRFYHRRLNRLLQAAYAEGMAKERPLRLMLPDRPVDLLPPTVGLLHLLVHFANHLVSEGVGLRQLCDIVMYVTRRHRDIDAALLDAWISQLRLRRLTDALFTWAADHLRMPAYDSVRWQRCPAGAAVLGNLVMESGNYGQRYQSGRFEAHHYRFHKFRLLVRRSGRVVRLLPDELLAAWRGKAANACRSVVRKCRRQLGRIGAAKHRLGLLLFLSLPGVGIAHADVPADTVTQGIGYRIEAGGTAGGGDYAPLWFTANRQGLSSAEAGSAYLRAGVSYRRELPRGWRVAAGLDLAGTYRFTSDFVVQQAYADVGWRWGNLSIGSKERWPEMKDAELSSGGMVEGSNARPVPQVRLEIPDYVVVPGTRGWFALKGHIAYGRFTDDRWQRSFAAAGTEYLSGLLYHSKAIYFKVGKRQASPWEFEFGLHMAAQFGGKVYSYDEERRSTLLYDLPSGIKDALKMIIPSSGGSDTPSGEQVNVYGNHVGSWNFALTVYPADDWRIRIYYEHLFEDHSQMFFEYGRWRDGHIGVQLDFPANPWLSSVVWEGLGTKDQSGPILYDGYAGAMTEYQVSANDDYYNNGLYLAWQHWGLGMGNPLLPGPIYNKDGEITFRSNRVLAQHVGLRGKPAADWSWRILLSYARHWGTYRNPLDNVCRQFNSLWEVRWHPSRWQGWGVTAALGLDRGNYLGNNTGFQLIVSKQGWLGRRNAK